MTNFQRALPSTSKRRQAAAPLLANAPFFQTDLSVTSSSLSNQSKVLVFHRRIVLHSQVCQMSIAKGSGDDHAEDAEESSTALIFTQTSCLEEPDTPRLFLSAAQSKSRVLGSCVLHGTP